MATTQKITQGMRKKISCTKFSELFSLCKLKKIIIITNALGLRRVKRRKKSINR
jgi:predicted transposase YbfD/YdcC